MIRKKILSVCITGFTIAFASQAMAHFGMVIPTSNVTTQEKKDVDITLSFSHPFEMVGMDLAKPDKFYVVKDGKKTDLKPGLSETKIMGHKAWKTNYKTKRPGVYQFVMEPAPYWEPAEELSIIHYTKTVLSAFGDAEGWDEPVGLPVEIIPMLRPFGNYEGNSFTGKVVMNGKVVSGAEVEVEFYNQDNKLVAPTDHHVTQVVKADKNGVFTFTCPRNGWWGFSALNEADYTLPNPQGENKPVELGGVLWIYLDKYKNR